MSDQESWLDIMVGMVTLVPKKLKALYLFVILLTIPQPKSEVNPHAEPSHEVSNAEETHDKDSDESTVTL